MLVPLERMWERVEVSREDSDTAFFHELLYLGELATKITVIALLAGLEEDRERQRYSIEHRLVRANSIGDWISALTDLTDGPASNLIRRELDSEKAELKQRWTAAEDSWQRKAVDLMDQAAARVEIGDGPVRNKVPLTRWFQTFGALRNRTRGHGTPTGGKCADMAALLEQSLKELSEFSAFGGTWIYLHRNLTGKYRVVPISGDASQFSFLKSENHHQYPDGIYRGMGEHLGAAPLIYSDVDRSDFFVANGNFRSSGFETLSYGSDELKTIAADAYTTPPSELPASGTSAGPELDMLGDTFVNLPSTTTDYVSRKALEGELDSLLGDDRHPLVTLVGRGGIGKTSLALEVLYRIAARGDYFAILWFSARDIDLLPQGPKPVQPDVLTQDEIAKQFVRLINPAGSASKAFDPTDYLARSMSGSTDDGPYLLVFDNFETVRNQGDVFRFVDTHIRLPNKVLITSRDRTFRGDYPLEVGGMDFEEFTALAGTTAARLGISDKLTSSVLEDLYEESDGHPYIVKVLLGEMAISGRSSSVRRVIASRDDILEALFDRTFDSLPPAAQRTFLTLAGWRSMVPRLAIEATLQRPANERMDPSEAIDALERSSMIEIVEGPSESEAFLRLPLSASLFGKGKLAVSGMRPAIEADLALLLLFGPTQLHEADRGLEPKAKRFAGALAEQALAGHDIREGVAILQYIARQFPSAWLILATLSEEVGPKSGVLDTTESLQKYLEQAPSDASAWRQLAGVLRSGDPNGELNALLQVTDLPDATMDDISLVAHRFTTLTAQGSLSIAPDVKRQMVSQIRRKLEGRTGDADATALSRLSWICLHDNDETAAKRYAKDGLKLDPSNQHCQKLINKLS